MRARTCADPCPPAPAPLAETPLRIDLQNDLPYLARAEFAGEYLLFVTVAGGGNACPTLWASVAASAAGAKATEPFGTCSEAILNPRLTMDALVAFDMAPVTAYQPWMTHTIDGKDIRETALPDAP